MAVSPWDAALKRSELRRETKRFPLASGGELVLTLEDLDPCGEGRFLDLARDLVEKHVEGRKPLLSPHGKKFVLSRHMCGVVAHLVAMQRPNPDEADFTPYSVIDWLGWSDTTAWEAIEAFLNSFFEAPSAGNSPRSDQETTEPTGNSSPPLSAAEPTPNTPPE